MDTAVLGLSKVHKHTKSEQQKFEMPAERFQHIHCDIVGPLPESHWKSYSLIVIHRVTCWPEEYPLKNNAAQTIIQIIYKELISRYDILLRITTEGY